MDVSQVLKNLSAIGWLQIDNDVLVILPSPCHMFVLIAFLTNRDCMCLLCQQTIGKAEFRVLIADGDLASIRRLHFHILELFVEPSLLMPEQPSPTLSGGYGMSGGGRELPRYTLARPLSTPAFPTSVPLSALPQMGVPPEIVRQLR